MKIRNGFVSNSSSSSFVVIVDENRLDLDGKGYGTIATEEDIKKLKEYGFSSSHSLNIKKELRYYVSCNQDFVLYFLMKNNIPFKAFVHYDHEFYTYKKDSDYMLKAHNFGKELEMYGEDNLYYVSDKKPIERLYKEEWLKDQEKFYGEKELNYED